MIGDPLDRNTNMGSLISQQHWEKVKSYIDLAKEEGFTFFFSFSSFNFNLSCSFSSPCSPLYLGGIICCGGDRPDLPEPFSNGNFMLPTVITVECIISTNCGLNHMVILQIIIIRDFLPVLGVLRKKYLDQLYQSILLRQRL